MGIVWARSRRFSGFVVVPALSLLTPLVVIPLVARHGGPGAVVAVAVGQSVGFVGSLLLSLAWPLIGPPRIARLVDDERPAVFAESLDSRSLVFVLIAPACAAVAAVLAPTWGWTAALSAVAITNNGFTAAWYYAGVGRPRGLLVNEALVRLASAGTAALALACGAPVVAYPALLCAGAGASYVLNSRSILGHLRRPRLDRHVLEVVRSQLVVTGARLVNGAYQAAAVSIVAAVAPGAVLTFSAFDRLQKSLLLASQAAVDAVISWVAAPVPGLRRRQVSVLVADAVIASVLGAAFYLALPTLVRYMYAGLITCDTAPRLLAAVGLAVAVLSKGVLSHALIPTGHQRFASTALTAMSVFGVVATAAAAAVLGVEGALSAVILAEGIFVIVGLVGWTRRGVADLELSPAGVVA